MKQPPIVFTGEWVLVALAQETHVVSVLKLLQRNGVAAELAKVFFYRALIFIATVNQLFFLLPLNLLRDARRLNGEGKQHDGHEKHDGEEDVASLSMFLFVRASLQFDFSINHLESSSGRRRGGKRNGLLEILQHIFQQHKRPCDAHDLIAPVYNVSLFGDKHFIAFRKKCLHRFAGPGAEPIELQIDGRPRRRGRRSRSCNHGRHWRHNLDWRRFFHAKDIARSSLVFNSLGGDENVIAQGGIQRVVPHLGNASLLLFGTGGGGSRWLRRGGSRRRLVHRPDAEKHRRDGDGQQHDHDRHFLFVFCSDFHLCRFLQKGLEFYAKFHVPALGRSKRNFADQEQQFVTLQRIDEMGQFRVVTRNGGINFHALQIGQFGLHRFVMDHLSG